ncbi:MAG: RsiV family protein [Oscillospiraceae bacterium]|nr:RsiV family protein [Oscillospiraceae bacterium]
MAQEARGTQRAETLEAHTRRAAFPRGETPVVLRYELSVPQGAARAWPRGGRRVDRCYRRLAGCLERDARRSLLRRASRLCRAAAGQEIPFTPAAVALSYTVTLLADGVLSLYRDYTEEADAGAGAVWRAAETWNLCDGCPVALRSLLGRRRAAYAGLLAAAEPLLDAQRRVGAPLYKDFPARARRFFSAERFYLTMDEIVIFWNPGLLAPRCAGVCRVRVPYGDIDLTRPMFREPAHHPLWATLPGCPDWRGWRGPRESFLRNLGKTLSTKR